MRRGRVVVALTTAAAVAIGSITLALGAAADSNKGTIKVADEAGCTEISNDPKIVDEFWVAGFNFAAGEEGTLTVATQPGKTVVLGPVAVTAGEDGSFCAGPFLLEEGQYKVGFVFTSASGKSKVFKVEITPPDDEPEPPPEEEEPETPPEETTPPTTTPTAPPTTTTQKPSAQQQAQTWTPIPADVPQTGF